MNQKLKVFGGFFGMTAVIIGAFGAHALSDHLSIENLKSFETAVKYQMYHALLLLILGFNLKPKAKFIKSIGYLLAIGILCFSGSIYLLATNSMNAINFKAIAFITPIGGTLLILGWILIIASIWKKK